MTAPASFLAGSVLALAAGALWSGCGCDDTAVVPIAAGTYALVSPDPTPYVGYVLSYSAEAGTVHERFTRGGVEHATVYEVVSRTP